MISLLLVIAAFICLLLCAFNVPVARPHLGWLGLSFYVLAGLVGAL